MIRSFIISIAVFSIFVASNNTLAVEPKNIHDLMVYEFDGYFEATRDDLKDVIKSRGLVISYVAHAKTMLDRTAKVVGVTKSAYPNGAEIMLFCKSDISHALTQANPHYIGLCPYAISVYDTQEADGKVFLSYRKFPSGIPETEAIEELLKGIIAETIGE